MVGERDCTYIRGHQHVGRMLTIASMDNREEQLEAERQAEIRAGRAGGGGVLTKPGGGTGSLPQASSQVG